MQKAPHDTGFVRWYVFVPKRGRWLAPQGVTDREGSARRVGVTRLLLGNEVRWSASPRTHLEMVR